MIRSRTIIRKKDGREVIFVTDHRHGWQASLGAAPDGRGPCYVTKLGFHPERIQTKKMSYNVSAHYAAETNMKNRLKADAKPSVGIISGRNAPLIKSNDTSCLHLLMAAIAAWNTVYLTEAIATLRKRGEEIPEATVAHVAPLGWEHIRLIGDYHFAPQRGAFFGESSPIASARGGRER